MRGAEVIDVDLGPGAHAFFTTRTGGHSDGPFASLNLGGAVGDRPEAVRANRAAVDAAAGGPVRFATQVHGAGVLGPECADGEADAVLGQRGAVGVLVADCVPILLAGHGLVAAVHAGRKGLLGGVIQAALTAMSDRGSPARFGAIGPAICGRCYEVPAQLRDQAGAVEPATHAVTSWGTPALDLPAGASAILERFEVRTRRLGVCTYTDPRFYSYRRDGRTGRFAGVVRLLAATRREG